MIPAIFFSHFIYLFKSQVIDSNRPEPICGICMGNQMLGIAAGGNSYKLPLGNRGQNQPVMNLLSGQAFITPQVNPLKFTSL